MKLTRVVPEPSSSIDVGTPEARESLAEWYPRLSGSAGSTARALVRVNLVASIDGDASAGGATSDSLSSRVDRAIVGAIRRAADVVVTGAATVRAEGLILPRSGHLAVVTRGTDVASLPRPESLTDGARLLVLCAADTAARVEAHYSASGVTVEALSSSSADSPDVDDIVRILAERGARDIVCEGGPSLAGAFVEASHVDELCLTTSPVLAARALPLFGRALEGRGPGDRSHDDERLDLRQMLVDEAGFVYARWGFRDR
ncbi:dihydrofolate reductase family protein [Marisediminicola sp. LYQ134]|uniref:dihydrofolate reductase family protein n=1 Tax=Marisediminicola sp. LYQ134 TaxID=3391061 RepID=UPI003983B009